VIHYRFYNYCHNIIEQVILDHPLDNTLFVFPTAKAKKAAMKFNQKRWCFSQTSFITMEELKELFFTSSIPILREEKRTIALYNSLTSKQKNRLYVDNYFAFIKFANNFFMFWEEFNEEKIPSDKSLSELLPHNEVFDWQRDLYCLMQEMLEGYRNYLKKHCWTDKIFFYKVDESPENRYEDILKPLKNQYLGQYKHYLFVNQYYYTGLENRILKILDDMSESNEVVVCYQLPEALVNKEDNSVIYNLNPYKPHEKNYLTKNISVHITSDNFSMINALTNELFKVKDDMTIIDRDFFRSDYSRFMSPDKFCGRERELVTNSTIYNFFQKLSLLLADMIPNRQNITNEKIEPLGQKKTSLNYLLPLHTIKEIFADVSFFEYCNKTNETQEIVLREINALLLNDYYYVNLFDPLFGNSLSYKKENCLVNMINSLALLVRKLINVNSISDFVVLLGNKDGILIENLIAEREKSSDIITVFYDSIGNFSAIDDLGIINNSTFESYGRFNIQWIINLFMNNLRYKRFTYNYKLTSQRLDISTLLDSRNISYKNVAILNLNEGVIPGSRATPFLLNEPQRTALGLKTYDDIRKRERYYFFRLILNSENVWLFCQQNESDNIEISSFVEEMLQEFADINTVIKHYDKELASHFYDMKDTQKVNTQECLRWSHFRNFYNSVLHVDDKYDIDSDITRKLDFYIIPYEPNSDFKNNIITITNYGFQEMQDSLFSFYLKRIGGIEEEVKNEPLSNKLIGTIAHNVFQKLWFEIQQKKVSLYDNTGLSSELIYTIKNICANEVNSGSLVYKIPKTHSSMYFKSIVLPLIAENIELFFEINKETLNDKDNQIISEMETITCSIDTKIFNRNDTERVTLNKLCNYRIKLKGIPDLIIEDINKQKVRHIFDYKTGKVNKKLADQLVMYDLIYSLTTTDDVNTDPKTTISVNSNCPEDYEELFSRLRTETHSYFYSLIDGSQEKITILCGKNRKELIITFIDTLKNKLIELCKQGFTFGPKSGNRLHSEIIRSDLLRNYVISNKTIEDKPLREIKSDTKTISTDKP